MQQMDHGPLSVQYGAGATHPQIFFPTTLEAIRVRDDQKRRRNVEKILRRVPCVLIERALTRCGHDDGGKARVRVAMMGGGLPNLAKCPRSTFDIIRSPLGHITGEEQGACADSGPHTVPGGLGYGPLDVRNHPAPPKATQEPTPLLGPRAVMISLGARVLLSHAVDCSLCGSRSTNPGVDRKKMWCRSLTGTREWAARYRVAVTDRNCVKGS